VNNSSCHLDILSTNVSPEIISILNRLTDCMCFIWRAGAVNQWKNVLWPIFIAWYSIEINY